MVQDWTPCGANKYCVNATCVNHVFESKCNESCSGAKYTCSDNGSCVDMATRLEYVLTDVPTTNSFGVKAMPEIWYLLILFANFTFVLFSC